MENNKQQLLENLQAEGYDQEAVLQAMMECKGDPAQTKALLMAGPPPAARRDHLEKGLKTVVKLLLGNNKELYVSRGNIVEFRGDAIVNAANEVCLGGGGVDGVITKEGGEGLAQARRNLPFIKGTRIRCRTVRFPSVIMHPGCRLTRPD